jgi:hypothetical protein
VDPARDVHLRRHLSPPWGESTQRYTGANGQSCRIAGEFNDWRNRAERHLRTDPNFAELFEELEGQHAKMFLVLAPVLRVDRIYYLGLSPASATVGGIGVRFLTTSLCLVYSTYRIGKDPSNNRSHFHYHFIANLEFDRNAWTKYPLI